MQSTFVIAEAGSNHAGSIANALRLMECAARAGADAVKFQYCSDYKRFMRRRKLETQPYDFSIRRDWLLDLAEHCKKNGVEFMCSTFLPEDIEAVAPCVKRFKVSAYEAQDGEFVGAHLPFGKKILISEGFYAGCEILRCVSKYPCPDNEIRLNEIRDYDYDGLSDHTKNPLTGAIAVGAGAKYIETHFRLYDTPKECPDYEVARTPDELAVYIRNIRTAEVLMG